MLKKIKIVVAVVLVTVAIIIALQNRETVETKLLFVTVVMPRAALLFVTLVIGFTGGVITTWSIVTRSKKEATAGETP